MTLNPEDPIPSPLAQKWNRARRDYMSGVSAPLVAERHGLSVRSIRRRALAEGWRRSDTAPESPAAWSRAEAVDQFPELGAIDQARSNEQFYLMFAPNPEELRRYAFARAAEAAVMAHPAEAVVWMRLVNQLDRSGDRITREARPLDPADYVRASYLKELSDEVEAAKAAAAP